MFCSRTSGHSAEVELLEADAWASLHGAFASTSGQHAAAVGRWGRATALATRGVDAVAVNRAIGFGFDRRLDAGQLGELRAFYREAGKSRWFVDCSPDASADESILTEAGAVLGGHVIKLVAEIDQLSELPQPALQVIEAGRDDAVRFMDIVGSQLDVPEPVRPGIVSTIGHPGWRFYFALVDDRPVAGAAMFASGDGAWLGLMGTLPEFRRRGAQTALLSRRIRDARAAGCRWISAETWPETAGPNPSLRNMTRLGLRELYRRPWYRFVENGAQPPA